MAACSVLNCVECVRPEICGVCRLGFLLDENLNTCSDNCGVDFCVSCVTSTTCEKCVGNYGIVRSACVLLCEI